ncbi:MAG TPA: DUF1549 domain-containing protein, partial [Methylomirabilota bacterium]|nr:DUF1549 domain-containing protein [Methylomirabilota bacterium]
MAPITRNFRLCLAVWVYGAMGALASVDGGDTAHWAYVAPERPALPEVRLKDWPRNAIDFFVLDRLEKERLEPSPEADRATLIRRLSLDLIGLPPTMEEVDAFLRDREPGAYERIVDRLLASPRHGERWARPWLDMARYADTQGYEKDNRRSIWPYRDWVIGALNADMPFDRFTIEQLAGDLLPGATRDQKVATGFHRNTQTNTEGGTDDEEFRHAAVVDRVDTTMTVWMGTTFACAQCHDHKYDPISMKEYYRLYGFFNQTADEDQPDDRPVLELPTPGEERRMAELNSRLADLEGEYHAETPVLETSRQNWEENVRNALSAWRVAAPVDWKSEGGAVLQRQEDGSILAGGKNPANDVYWVELETGLREVTGLRLEVMPDESLPRKSLGRHENGSFVLTGFEVEAVPGN